MFSENKRLTGFAAKLLQNRRTVAFCINYAQPRHGVRNSDELLPRSIGVNSQLQLDPVKLILGLVVGNKEGELNGSEIRASLLDLNAQFFVSFDRIF